jgi:hypothetical protein
VFFFSFVIVYHCVILCLFVCQYVAPEKEEKRRETAQRRERARETQGERWYIHWWYSLNLSSSSVSLFIMLCKVGNPIFTREAYFSVFFFFCTGMPRYERFDTASRRADVFLRCSLIPFLNG